ncbi:MAG: bacteriohemerythrin [Leptospiraceae bacterium]|nr:bacteriohemerythrin [Leptospiraceae bacterium]MCP5510763.1 bacteriohemerythrin [Leptospiraceae bacterium]
MYKNIVIFPWNHNFETGIPEIDQQHKILVDLLNKLVTKLTFPDKDMKRKEIFDELKNYTVLHFKFEEEIWKSKLDEETYRTHKSTHDNFIEEVLQFEKKHIDSSLQEILYNVISFLTHWLAYHIIESDKKLAMIVLRIQNGESIREATLNAEAQMKGSIGAMIETIMTMYDQLSRRTIDLSMEIHKRISVEEKLKLALDDLQSFHENRFIELLEKVPFPILIVNPLTDEVMFSNNRATKQFQILTGSGERNPIHVFFKNRDDWNSIRSEIGEENSITDKEIILINYKNFEFYSLVSASKLKFNNFPTLMLAIKNIDKRKIAEENLKNEKSFLKSLYQTIPYPIWVKDKNGVYLSCNHLFETFFGAKEENIVGKTDYDFVDRDLADFFRKHDNLALYSETPIVNEEVLSFKDNGYTGLFETTKTAMYDGHGELIGVIGYTRDITSERKNQLELKSLLREQNCLYRVFAFTDNIDKSIESMIDFLIEIVPTGFQNPEKTHLKILFRNNSYQSDQFTDSPHKISVSEKTGKDEILELVLTYSGSEEPTTPIFLDEEKILLETIAHRLLEVIDRKHLSEEINEKEQLVSLMFSQTTDSIALVDLKGNIIDCNEAAYLGMGYTKEEFLKLNVRDFQAEHSSGEIEENSRNAQKGELINFETFHRDKFGKIQIVQLTIRPITLSGKNMISAVWRNITEQKEKEIELEKYRSHLEDLVETRTKELKEKNEELKGVFDSSSFGIAVVENRTIINCNSKLEEIFGYEPGELINQPKRIIYIDDDTYISIGKEIHNSIMKNQIYVKDEIESIKKNGERFWARIKVGLLNNLEDRTRLVAIYEDITESRKVSEELKLAKYQAEEAARAKSNFLANMSHEIRTPLNAIIGMTYLTQKSDLNPKQKEYLAKIQYSGEHLLSIINDILDYSKIEAQKFTIEHSEFNLETILKNISNLLSDRINEKNLELIFEISPEIPPVLLGDQLRIGQILINFVSNAIKFTEKGEITIGCKVIEKKEKSILLNFSVRDTGIGIGKHSLGLLFKSFQQADMSISRKYGGTGLGLAISKRLVELMDGNIGVESEEGKGSNFWFQIQLDLGKSRTPRKHLSSDLKNTRVLVVDDNKHARSTMRDILESFQIQADDCDSGKKALEELNKYLDTENPYKIIFLDWKMPDMDGAETAYYINSLPLRPRPEIVIVSGFGKAEVLENFQNIRIREILSKPLTPSILLDTTIRILRGDSIQTTQSILSKQPADYSKIRGARVLLVEDNEINIDVGRDLLLDFGLDVTIAENGRIALNLLQDNIFDIILMDMQMPVMDGITATGEIRKNPNISEIPIIAMTANALEENKLECLEAGMNDFLSKPIEINKLASALLRWIPEKRLQKKQQPQIENTPGNQNVNPKDLFEIKGINSDLGLKRSSFKNNLYFSILEKFYQSRTLVSRLEEAIQNKDYKIAQELTHSMKSSTSNIGAEELYASTTKLNTLLKQELDPAEISIVFQEFRNQIQIILNDLEIKIPILKKKLFPTSEKSSEYSDKLSILIEYLKSDNGITYHFFMENRSIFENYWGEQFDEIHKTILNFDFDKTLQKIENLRNPV